jgi:hypothetical protein
VKNILDTLELHYSKGVPMTATDGGKGETIPIELGTLSIGIPVHFFAYYQSPWKVPQQSI